MTSERGELERLRRENAALNEQVKLLVRTEQRLYRSQNDRERQLDRVRALARLALSCADPAESVTSILAHAAELLGQGFHVDDVLTLLRTPAGYRTVNEHGALDAEALAAGQARAIERWTSARSEVCVGDGALPAELCDALGLVELGPTAALPLADAQGAPLGLILAWRRARTPASFHRVELHEGHLPYLQLLRQHVESALRNASLTAELREHGLRLASSNERLTASLESLERTQQELVQARKMEAVGRLAGGVAHDFNNLLTVILNHAQTLREAHRPDSEERESATRILEAGRSAANITRQLLAFGRKEPRRPVALDLNALAADMTRMLARLLGERIELELDLSPGHGIVLADPVQVEQIVLNLVVNARDAMPDGGTLSIRTRPATEVAAGPDAPQDPSRYVALLVSDTGQGIDAENRARIFEPFFTTKGHGSGLGLSMVYGAVHQNDGCVAVASTPGVGTTFTIFLPLEPGPVEAAQPPPEQQPVRPDTTALVVEDEREVREVTVRILQRKGYAVLEAESAEQALERFAHVPGIDILVTDVILPGESGGRLARRLRAERPGLPVVFLSGYSFDELDSSQLEPNDEFLQKPFTPAALCARVRQALAAPRRRLPTS